MNGAIYHFTAGSEKRPIYCEKQLQTLEDFARSLNISVSKTYLDKSLKVSERCEFEAFMRDCELYEVLVTKDFYHIRTHTLDCIRVLQDLSKKGIKVCSIENGSFEFEEPPLDKPLRVATYSYAKPFFMDPTFYVQVQSEIFSLFTKEKTSWSLVKHYSDICLHQSKDEQVGFYQMIEERECFDILIVTNFADIDQRSTRFCKLRELLGKDIFSLQNGFLPYRRNE